MVLFLFMLLIKTRLWKATIIENCLKLVVKKTRKQRKSSGTNAINLLYGNARVHTHADVINYLTKECIIIMLHLLY